MSKILHILLVLLFSLTIISILFPSSPLFGREKGKLYPWVTTSGVAWKTFGDPRYQPEYKGEVSNGKPNGVGILYNGNPDWSKNDGSYSFSPRSIYIGEWVNGKMDGQGSFIQNDGIKKVGIFKKGIDWETTWYGSLGNTIKTFSKGKIVLKEYKGILFTHRSGSNFTWFKTETNTTDGKYEGEIGNGIPNGMGKLIFKNGEKFEGNWNDGKLNGKGIFISSDGRIYKGKWKKGEYHGIGTLTYPDGLRIVGEFNEGTDWNTKWYNNQGDLTAEYKEGISKK